MNKGSFEFPGGEINLMDFSGLKDLSFKYLPTGLFLSNVVTVKPVLLRTN